MEKNCINTLKGHSDAKHTGCLEVSKIVTQGKIYLIDGKVVEALFLDQSGEDALFTLFSWENPLVVWHPNVLPSSFRVEKDLDILVFEFENLPEEHFQNIDDDYEEKQKDSFQEDHYEDLNSINIVLYHAEDKSIFHELSIKEKTSYLIGSSEDCNIVLNSRNVASEHCSIMLEDGVIRLWDLGSDFGTMVNGFIIEETSLMAYDRIKVGDVELECVFKLKRPRINISTEIINNTLLKDSSMVQKDKDFIGAPIDNSHASKGAIRWDDWKDKQKTTGVKKFLKGFLKKI